MNLKVLKETFLKEFHTEYFVNDLMSLIDENKLKNFLKELFNSEYSYEELKELFSNYLNNEELEDMLNYLGYKEVQE